MIIKIFESFLLFSTPSRKAHSAPLVLANEAQRGAEPAGASWSFMRKQGMIRKWKKERLGTFMCQGKEMRVLETVCRTKRKV